MTNVSATYQNSSDLESSTPVPTLGVLVSNETRRIFQWICLSILLTFISSFGTVTNVINIICFSKQGLKDPVIVSLFGLAISDIGCLLTLIWAGICFNPAFQESDLPFEATEIVYLTGSWPHVVFTRITSWITALITLQRCLCVTLPLKVKHLITSKRMIIVLLCIFIILAASSSPVFYANRLGPKFYMERNKTLIGLIYTSDRKIIEEITFAVSNIFVPITAFFVIAICTAILVMKLREQSNWRLISAQSGRSDPNSNKTLATDRDQKVTKMVVMISTLFICCFIPISMTFVAMLIEPEISVTGRYVNTIHILASVGFLLESINSSMNIFIYYQMSSNYRDVFQKIFFFRKMCPELTT